MHLKNLYQTISDRGNPDYVEEHGPFICKSHPWLGVGYYFWDNLLTRAHWWGRIHCKNQYMICEAYAIIDDEKYLDLACNMEQLKWFKKCFEVINVKHQGCVKTVSFVIHKLMRDNNFPFQAVRVLSEKCGGDEGEVFVPHNHSFLNFSPPMQICIYDKKLIHGYLVVYPEQYALEGYV